MHVPDYPAIVAAERETDNPWSTVAVVSADDTRDAVLGECAQSMTR